jgi:hypothetical protein
MRSLLLQHAEAEVQFYHCIAAHSTALSQLLLEDPKRQQT